MARSAVVIVVDALRADRVGSCGGRALTENIDELAAAGTAFTNAFSVSNTTDVAMTSLQTGLYPLSHGVLNHGKRVTQEEKQRVNEAILLQEHLHAEGFRTVKTGRGLGRWHKRGFDRYPDIGTRSFKVQLHDWLYNTSEQVGRSASRLYGALEKAARSVDITGATSSRRVDNNPDPVDEFLEATDDADRFYGLVHLMDTHGPYEPDPELVEGLLNQFDYDDRPLRDVIDEFPADSITANNLRNKIERSDDSSLSTGLVRARYDAAVVEADKKVGQLVGGLADRGDLKDTLVVVLADHGESLGEHGIYFDHHGLYEPVIRIPLVVNPPTASGPDAVTDLVQVTDIFPTVLDCLDVSSNILIDGSSLLNYMSGGSSVKQRETIIAEEAHTQRRRMVRDDRWKLIQLLEGEANCRYCQVEHGPEQELYDLIDDLSESANLLENGRMGPERVQRELQEKATSLLDALSVTAPTQERRVTFEDEQEVLSRLEKLGYK